MLRILGDTTDQQYPIYRTGNSPSDPYVTIATGKPYLRIACMNNEFAFREIWSVKLLHGMHTYMPPLYHNSTSWLQAFCCVSKPAVWCILTTFYLLPMLQLCLICLVRCSTCTKAILQQPAQSCQWHWTLDLRNCIENGHNLDCCTLNIIINHKSKFSLSLNQCVSEYFVSTFLNTATAKLASSSVIHIGGLMRSTYNEKYVMGLVK